MDTQNLLKPPMHFENALGSKLRKARAAHVLVLHQAGIRHYGDLQRFDDPKSLVSHMMPAAYFFNIPIDIFDNDLVDDWFKQASNELPGKIITPDIP